MCKYRGSQVYESYIKHVLATDKMSMMKSENTLSPLKGSKEKIGENNEISSIAMGDHREQRM